MVSVISVPVTIPSLGVAVMAPLFTASTVKTCGKASNCAVTVTA